MSTEQQFQQKVSSRRQARSQVMLGGGKIRFKEEIFLYLLYVQNRFFWAQHNLEVGGHKNIGEVLRPNDPPWPRARPKIASIRFLITPRHPNMVQSNKSQKLC